MAEKKKEKELAEIRSSLLSKETQQPSGSIAPRAGVTAFGAGGKTASPQAPGSGLERQWAPLSSRQFGSTAGPIQSLSDRYDISSANMGNRGYQLYKLTSKDGSGENLYYMNDPYEGAIMDKRGSKWFQDVPNLYLAYKQGMENADQYVIPYYDIVGKPGPQQRFVPGERGGGRTETYTPELDEKLAKGYFFKVDPFTYGATQRIKKAHSFGSPKEFGKQVAPILGIAAAPLTAGLSAYAGMSAPVAGAIVGGTTGALANPEDPLKGAVLGGGGGAVAPALSKAGVSNVVAQKALTGALLARLGDRNVLYGTGTGALAGLGAQSAALEQQDKYIPQGGEEDMAGFDFMGDFSGGNVDFGGGGGLDTSSFGGDMFGGSYNQDFGGFSPDMGTGDFMGGELSQGLWTGGGGQGFDFGGGGLGLQPGGGMGLQGPGGYEPFSIDQFGGGSGQPSTWDRLKGGAQEFGRGLNTPGGKFATGMLDKAIGAYGTNRAANKYQQIANQASQRADPFAGQRAGYQSQLSRLFSDPSYIYERPSYKSRVGQGTDAVRRMMAAKGYGDSGNELAEVGNYVGAQAGNEFWNEANMLAQLSGGYANPAASGQMYGQMAAGGVPYDLSTILQGSSGVNDLMELLRQQGVA